MNSVFFNFIETEVNSLSKYPTLINDIANRQVDGVVVRNFLSDEELTGINERIKNNEYNVVKKQTFGHVVGATLTQSNADLSDYLPASAAFVPELNHLCGFNFEARFSDMLQSISQGIKCQVPHVEGQQYTPANFRVMNPGFPMTVHVGREFLANFNETKHIASLIDSTFQFSFFVVINQPDAGGELVLFNLRYPDSPEKRFNNGVHINVEARIPWVRSLDQMQIKPTRGSLILFNGGDIWHRVAEIEGSVPRITLGGFMGIDPEKKNLYYWS